MFQERSLLPFAVSQLAPTRDLMQCEGKGQEYFQPLQTMEDCFITDLEDFLNSTDIPKEADKFDFMKATPTPSPTNMEVPDFFGGYSPAHTIEDMASPPCYKELGVPSPPVVIKEESPLNSPPSLYHDRCMMSPKEEKPKYKYGHLVSLLSAPPMPMTNTINENIISQLGHASATDKGTRTVGTANDVVIKKEVVECDLLNIKKEIVDTDFDHSSLNQPMASGTSAGPFPCDIGSLAMEHAYRDIQTTCNTLNISFDPTKWSTDDVRCWLMHTTHELKLPAVQCEYFQIDGSTLCSLSESEFIQRAPQCGETLYAQLYVWRTASIYFPGCMSNTQVASPQQSVYDDLSMLHSTFGSPGSPDSFESLENTFIPNVRSSVSESMCQSVPSCSSSFPHEQHHSDDEITSEDGECTDMQATETAPAPKTTHSHIHLWQFLKELLSQPHIHGSCIRWIDRAKGIFKIEDSVRVARLWGKRKNRPAMNYDKLSRSIRQYYKKGIMKKTERSQRLVYQFCTPYCL